MNYVVREQDSGIPTLRNALSVADGTLTLSSPDSRSSERGFTAVDFFDPAVDAAAYRDHIVLGAGVADADADAVASALASGGAAALILRRPPPAGQRVRRQAAKPGMPVMSHSGGDWAQLATVLRSLLGTHAAEDIAGVRLGDLFGLANALATLAEGAVSIIDSTGQVIGYSTHEDQPIDDVRRRTTLLLQEELPIARDRRYQDLLRTSAPRHFPSHDDLFGRVGISVRASGELLGSIWVVQVDPTSAQRTEDLLEKMAPLAAQHLLRSREDLADRDRRRSNLLRTLLDDRRHARSAASQLLIRPEAGCTIVCFRIDTFDGVEAMRGLHRLLHLAISLSGVMAPGSHSAIIEAQVVTLIPGADLARVREFAQSVIRTDGALIAGIGRRGDTVPGIARSFRDAATAAGALMAAVPTGTRTREPRVAAFDDVRDRLAVMEATDLIEGMDVAIGDAASMLTEHDATHGTDLARTVRTYLDRFGSVRDTALALHVHQNTVRYRLDVVRTELGIALDSPDTRLWLWLRLASSTGRVD
jgi:hypothetical protein